MTLFFADIGLRVTGTGSLGQTIFGGSGQCLRHGKPSLGAASPALSAQMRPFLHLCHVAWYVCLCAGHTGGAVQKRLNRSIFNIPFGGQTLVGQRNLVLDGV